MKKIYTCTPVAFHANEGFHIRDTGLIAAGLRALNIESKCIMPLPSYEDDLDLPLIRTEYKNLSKVSWWKSLELDGIILYSWAHYTYLPIARAIHKAGIPLSIHLDTSASFAAKPLRLNFRSIQTGILNILRSIHLSYADVITIAKPGAEVLSKHPLFRHSTVNKFVDMACPVSSECSYDGQKKEKKIIAIGRWNDIRQKRPEFLMQTLQALYTKTKGCEVVVEIYGRVTDAMRTWHQNLPEEISSKIFLKGYVNNKQLTEQVYNSAQIILCSSLYESSHIVSCEALCCGCSVVTTNRPNDLRFLHWYTTKNSGMVSEEDTPESLAKALADEVQNWEKGKRDPFEIARTWQPHFHVDKVLPEIIRRFEQVKK